MASTYEVVAELVEVEKVSEKMPESLWHSEIVDTVNLKSSIKDNPR